VRAFPGDGHGARARDPERIDWLIWVHFAETLSQHIATLTQQHIVLREDHMRSPVLMKIEAKRAEKCLEAIAARLGGAGVSARQRVLGGGCERGAGRLHGAAFREGRSRLRRLQAWYDRITARPGFIASLPVEDDARLYTRDYYEPWEVT
jgi:glutathione S-transferase